MYIMQVKTPAESKGPWDYYKLVDTMSGEEAFGKLAEFDLPAGQEIAASRRAGLSGAADRLQCDMNTGTVMLPSSVRVTPPISASRKPRMAVAAGDDHIGAEIGGVRQQQIGRVALARQAAEARLDPQPREAPRDALAAVDDRLRLHRRIGGDDLDMLGAREQRPGVADRPRRRLAAVPRGDDAVEARGFALDAGHDDDRATALGEESAGEVVEVGGRPGSICSTTTRSKPRAKAGASIG